jgi:hypothetical protein
MNKLRITLGTLMFGPLLLASAGGTANAMPSRCTTLAIHDTTYIRCYGPDGRLISETECWTNVTGWDPYSTDCQDRTPPSTHQTPRGE